MADAWGNLLQKNVIQGTAEPKTLIVNNKNQVTTPAFTYDAATLHPKTAVHLWPWITQSFLRAGRPIDALLFLSSLSATCCDNAGLSRIRGDVFLILKNEPQAAVEYSSWLSSGQDHCGSQSSLLNVSYLKSKGFDLPDIATSLNSNNAICISLNEWHPYVRLSARYMK
ncbi:MAG TPA: hypothetical protein VGK24_02305 [Candidatus Angelobacter sp.]|jgi:hypothetical protein